MYRPRGTYRLTLIAPAVLVAATLTSATVFAQLRGTADAIDPGLPAAEQLELIRLATTGNPSAQPSAGLAQSIQVESTVVMLTLSPGSPGPNEATIMYFSVDSASSVDLEGVRLSYLDHSGVQFDAALTERHAGHVYCRDLVLPHAGRWRLEAMIRTPQGTEPATFDLAVGGLRQASGQLP